MARKIQIQDSDGNVYHPQVEIGTIIDLRIVEDKLQFFNGYDWKTIDVDPKLIRDIDNVPLKVQVSTVAPTAETGRIYYNSKDNLFYMSRNNQWYRLFIDGDEKLDREPPKESPKLLSKTDTTVTLQSDEDMEFRYQGGSWQDEPYFAGLQRNETYKFEPRYKTNKVYKASPPSPALEVTTDKGEQTPPNKPTISNIQHDRATVRGETNTEVSLNKSTWYSSPHTFTGLKDKTGYTAYARRKETGTHNVSPASSGASFTTPSKTPGSGKLIAGTMTQGFFGEVPSSEFITGNALCSKLGITEGTSQFSTGPWLKFALDGKILFRPKKTIRHSISWNHISSKNCVYGDKIIEINGIKYRVRLMKGALTNPSKFSDSDKGAKGSEWNKLMLPIHIQAKNKSWDYPSNVESNIPYWGIDYTNADLQLGGTLDGRSAWCQEKTNESGGYHVGRGNSGVSYSNSHYPDRAYSNYGFAPVLEVV